MSVGRCMNTFWEGMLTEESDCAETAAAARATRRMFEYCMMSELMLS